MKRFKFFTAITVVAGSFFFLSCNSGGNKADEAAGNKDSTATQSTAKETTPANTKPGNVLIIRHKVANFEKWKVAYEAHDSTRLVYGLHNFVIGRGLKDSNMVMVVMKMDDTAKAKEFAALPNLKAAMKKGGVVGAPSFLFVDNQMVDSSSVASTQRVIITHKVKDWDAWKKSFDSSKQDRLNAGLADRAVGYSVGDPHTVIVAFVITDLPKAEAFVSSKDLKDKMAKAGVAGPPDIFFYHVVQNY
jgi:hypothetical protein